MEPTTPKSGGIGSLLSIIVIVAVLVVGAFYVWGKRIAAERGVTIPTDSQNL